MYFWKKRILLQYSLFTPIHWINWNLILQLEGIFHEESWRSSLKQWHRGQGGAAVSPCLCPPCLPRSQSRWLQAAGCWVSAPWAALNTQGLAACWPTVPGGEGDLTACNHPCCIFNWQRLIVIWNRSDQCIWEMFVLLYAQRLTLEGG